MRLWGLVVQIYALLALPVKAVESDEADMIVLNDSPVKNVVRAVRSSPSFTAAPDDLEDSHDTSTGPETNKPDDFSRSLRGRDNFIRFGRGKNDNFMRFGRGKQDNFMRFGRSNAVEREPDKEPNDYDRFVRTAKGNKKSESERFERLTKNFIRLGRGKQDNFMRFGRGKQDNFMRFGRGKQDNFMRFGKGKQDNFMRFGRGKQDNFMRFGRGKQDNFMRFGRGKQDNFMRFGRGMQDNFMRFGRGKESNYMRFGRDVENFDLPSRKVMLDVNDLLDDTRGKYDSLGNHLLSSSDSNIPIAMRSSSFDLDNFNRFIKSRQDNFLRFGKSNADLQSSETTEFSEDLKHDPGLTSASTVPEGTSFTRIMKSNIKDDINLLRQGRHPPNKDDSFTRFDRNSQDSSSTYSIPQRLKRSTIEFTESQDNMLPSKVYEGIRERMLQPGFYFTDYHDEDLSSSEQLEDYNSRRKRSAKILPPQATPTPDWLSVFDHVSIKPLNDPTKTDFIIMPLFIPSKSSSFSSEE